jgi:hypothetical protein
MTIVAAAPRYVLSTRVRHRRVGHIGRRAHWMVGGVIHGHVLVAIVTG